MTTIKVRNTDFYVPKEILDKLPVIKNMAEYCSDKIVIHRSDKLFEQILDYLLNGDVYLSQAMITELDFYGLNLIPDNFSRDKFKRIIDNFNIIINKSNLVNFKIGEFPITKVDISIPSNFNLRITIKFDYFSNDNIRLPLSYYNEYNEPRKNHIKLKPGDTIFRIQLTKYDFNDFDEINNDIESKLQKKFQDYFFSNMDEIYVKEILMKIIRESFLIKDKVVQQRFIKMIIEP